MRTEIFQHPQPSKMQEQLGRTDAFPIAVENPTKIDPHAHCAYLRENTPLDSPLWRSSSGGPGVAVAVFEHGYVGLKNELQSNMPALMFTPGEWKAFIGGAKEDEFDLVEFTNRESQVVNLKAQGFRDKQIASRLGISPHTVEGYSTRINEKCHTNNMLGSVMQAMDHKKIDRSQILSEANLANASTALLFLSPELREVADALILSHRLGEPGDSARDVLRLASPRMVPELTRHLGARNNIHAAVIYRMLRGNQ